MLEDVPVSSHRTLKSVHLAATVWFVICVGYILAIALHQAGFNWWLIFSLSGHWALLFFMLVSLYLFALARGVGEAQQIEIEHPLTTTSYYMGLYVSAPFLGALAGLIGMVGAETAGQFFLGVALGTLATTFFVWVVLDPAAGVVEMTLPKSRKHRAERLALAEAQRRKRQEKRDHLLAELLAKEESQRSCWQEVLKPQAERLAALLETDGKDFERAQREAADIGANAWQTGGLNCMRELRNMAIAISAARRKSRDTVDYISVWWDGIGNWRKPSPY